MSHLVRDCEITHEKSHFSSWPIVLSHSHIDVFLCLFVFLHECSFHVYIHICTSLHIRSPAYFLHSQRQLISGSLRLSHVMFLTSFYVRFTEDWSIYDSPNSWLTVFPFSPSALCPTRFSWDAIHPFGSRWLTNWFSVLATWLTGVVDDHFLCACWIWVDL